VLEGQIALPQAAVAAQAGLSAIEAGAAAESLRAHGELVDLPGGWLMARASWGRLLDALARELAAYHAAYPLQLGMPREALRSRLKLTPKLFNDLMPLIVEAQAAVDEGVTVRLPEHQMRFTAGQQAAVDDLLAQIQANPTATPSVKDATALVGEDVLQALIARGDLVQVNEEVLFDAVTYASLVKQVQEHIQAHGAITVAQARDLFNSSRKYVLGLLEHLDAIGVTRRMGDERVLRR
jgi:selenocysteine-specific elongation factor